MSFEQKVTWVSVVVTVAVAAVYAWVVGSQVAGSPVDDIAYQIPMLVAVGAIIVLTIAGAIAVSIGSAIRSEITGEGSVDDIGRKDERDVHIGRRGDLVSYYVLSALTLAALVLTMLEYPLFWIANALFAAFLIAGLIGSVVKLVTYHRGF